MPSESTLISVSFAILAIIITVITTNLPARVLKISSRYPYQAILDDCGEPGEFSEIIQGEYAVKLKPKHSLSDHSAAIGTDIEGYISYYKPQNTFFDMNSIFYVANNVNQELFNAIRADRGVYLISCSKAQSGDFGLDPERERFLNQENLRRKAS
ncbi:hypothetical protein EJ08DRAFT_702636 [Tothia fuscella]|uniref:Uncharacterized protein n=1 Tax=Tothia fuscella TaxID=1048955 RepID=A0A9P4NFY1_9PEZI|nr:hypothetical protein EJ08DRAFT_702636 [Tothia fuscella]